MIMKRYLCFRSIVAVLITIFAVLIAETISSAVVTRGIKLHDNGGDILSVTIITKVQNGTVFVNVDSSVVSAFPNDTVINMNDTANWIVQYLWNMGGGDTLANDELVLFSPSIAGGVAPTESEMYDYFFIQQPGQWSATGSGGSGFYTVTIVSTDSSDAPHTAIQDMNVQLVNTSTQEVIGPQRADANGVTTWKLDAGNYNILQRLSHYLSEDTNVTVSANQTDSAYAYFVSPQTPISSSTCMVNGYITKLNGDPIPNAKVTLTAPSNVKYNSCDGNLLLERSKFEYTNSDGYYEIPVVWSSCLDDKKYTITVEHVKYSTKEKTITVPDTISYEVVWDDN